jgi:hypothetical protein
MRNSVFPGEGRGPGGEAVKLQGTEQRCALLDPGLRRGTAQA